MAKPSPPGGGQRAAEHRLDGHGSVDHCGDGQPQSQTARGGLAPPGGAGGGRPGLDLLAFLWLAPRLFRDAWFERAIADFGQGTGVTATGLLLLLLLRMADPHSRSGAPEAFSFQQLVFEPFLGVGLVTAFAAIALVSLGLPLWTGLAALLTLASLGFGMLVRRQALG